MIKDCNFTGNRLAPEDSTIYTGGGGVHIVVSSCPPGIVCDGWDDSLYEASSDNIYWGEAPH